MAMMKSSNTEWLGDIPAEWDVAQIGNYYELRNEKVSDYDFEPLSVTMKGIVTQLATAAKSDDHSNRKLVKKGDFVINSRSDRRGSCGISPLDGSVSLINIVMEPRGEMNPQYYNWLFHTEQFADEFYKWGHGIVDDLWTTRWQEMKKILIVAPLPDEQQAIADYLDETCSKIDEIIAEAKASIDEYKELKQSVIFEAVTKGLDKNVEMKDSGVEWIGLCPKHWVVSRIKNECSNLDNLREPVSADNRENKLGLYDYYGASGVIDKIDYYNVDDVVLLIGEDGANLRMRNLPLVYRASGKFWVNNHAHIVTGNDLCDTHYLCYLINSMDLSGYVTGSAQPKLSQANLNAVTLLLPRMEIQKKIVDYLRKIDEKIELNTQINKNLAA